MSDTPQTTAQLQTDFADNDTGDITAQRLRNFVVSVLNILDTPVSDFAKSLLDDTNAGAMRTTLGLGTAAVANTGTGSSNVILGNDSRLTDARTPTTHHTSHESAGTDPVTLAQSQVTGLTSALSGKASTAHASTHNPFGGSDPITHVSAHMYTYRETTLLKLDGTNLGDVAEGISFDLTEYPNEKPTIFLDSGPGGVNVSGPLGIANIVGQNGFYLHANGDMNLAGNVNAATFTGDGTGITGITPDTWYNYPANNTVDMNGNGINNVEHITTTSATVTNLHVTGTAEFGGHTVNNIGDLACNTLDVGSGHVTIDSGGDITTNNAISAPNFNGGTFTGDGSGLVNINAAVAGTANNIVPSGDQNFNSVNVSGIAGLTASDLTVNNTASFMGGIVTIGAFGVITLNNGATVTSFDVVGASGTGSPDIRLISNNGIGLANGCGINMDTGGINTSGACSFGNVGCGIFQPGGGDPDTAPNNSMFIDINTGNLVWKTIDGIQVIANGPA